MPSQTRNRILSTQPGKAIWTTLHILFNTARLPFWLIYYIPRGLRQDKRHTYKKAIGLRILRAFLTWSSEVEIVTPWSLQPDEEKDQWTTVNPADAKYYAGITKIDSEITPCEIGGTWYPSNPKASGEKKTKVFLHFHGGAYVIGDGRKKNTAFMCKNVVKKSGITPHVFSVQYRLASNPGGHFPAALQDAITAYAYLLFDQGYDASDIIVGGDSAGANLTLSLLRYIANHGTQVNLPTPSAAWLFSPWVDPGGAVRDRAAFDQNPQAPTDYLNSSFGAWGALRYEPATSTGLDIDHEYINFLKHPFKTDTPLYFSVGENEVLFNDGNNAYIGFSGISGNKTQFAIEMAAPHDVVLVGELCGFVDEAGEAIRKAGAWASKL